MQEFMREPMKRRMEKINFNLPIIFTIHSPTESWLRVIHGKEELEKYFYEPDVGECDIYFIKEINGKTYIEADTEVLAMEKAEKKRLREAQKKEKESVS